MDLYLDAEWFIGGEIFLIGWSRDKHQCGQLYEDSLTAERFQEVLDGTTGIIYFYGPDIGPIKINDTGCTVQYFLEALSG